MSKTASADIEKLSKLLAEELELYGQIQKLTEEQTDLLSEDDIDAFNSSLDKREELIEKIKGLHQDSNPLMHSCVSNDKIDELMKKIRKTLETCSKLNDKNEEILREKTQDHTKKIDEQSSKRKGIGGYAQSVPNTPEMFDKKT